ncbi:MAG: hypothetical protein QM808_10395 [Steroidobacteraceae bacterium]
MRSATANVAAAPLERSVAAEPRMRADHRREESLLKLDLSDLVLPKVNDLHVDGLKSSWLSRLLGKR